MGGLVFNKLINKSNWIEGLPNYSFWFSILMDIKVFLVFFKLISAFYININQTKGGFTYVNQKIRSKKAYSKI